MPAKIEKRRGLNVTSYTYDLSQLSNSGLISATMYKTASPTVGRQLQDAFFDTIVSQFKQVGKVDARVLERRTFTYSGHRATEGRLFFTPFSPPRIPNVWLIRTVQAGNRILFLQTIVSPTDESSDYLAKARVVHAHFVNSLRFS